MNHEVKKLSKSSQAFALKTFYNLLGTCGACGNCGCNCAVHQPGNSLRTDIKENEVAYRNYYGV